MMAQSTDTGPITLSGKWRTLAHAAWWIVFVVTLGVWIGAFLNDYQVHQTTELTAAQLDLLDGMGLSHQAVLIYIFALKALTMGVFLIIAALIFWRRLNEWHTLMISTTLILAGSVVTWVFPTLTTSEPYLYSMSILITTLGWFAFGLLFMVFPDGHLVPKWARWFLVGYFIIIILSNFIEENPFRRDTTDLGQAIVIGLFFVFGITAQVYRYFRVSTRIQQQQTKWVVYAFIITALLLILIDLVSRIIPDISDPNNSLGAFFALFFYDLQYRIVYLLIPVALGVAILQYRLFDIDVIIRRTLVYTILTVLLGLIYFGGVALIQRLFTGLTGQASPIAVVISTLLIAALFTSVRSRVQSFIDKRFYRARYNAERSLERFSMVAREEVELERLEAELVDVVQETMQPEHIDIRLVKIIDSK